MNSLNSLGGIPVWALFGIYIWSILWKGLALWKASKLEQRNWFVAMLVLNTVGILEIAFLFFFAKKRLNLKDFKNLKFWEKK